MRRVLSAIGVFGVLLSGCAGAPDIHLPATRQLADPCLLATPSRIHAAFILGVRGDVSPLNDDPSSRSCLVTVHDINGDEHLVVSDALDGAAIIAATCDPRRDEGMIPLSVGDRGCWRPGRLAAAATRHGILYSVAVVDNAYPTDYQAPMQTLLTAIVKGA